MERRSPGVRELSRARCFEMLATTSLGRVGVSVRALPVILPVRYAVTGERLVFRSLPGAKLEAAVHRLVVAFEADGYDPGGAWGWSVLLQGVATEIIAAAEVEAARALLGRAWPPVDGETARLVAIGGAFVSGRAFGTLPER
jgi:nitroimidazol reductase NimA-like FMN-containing flavoprotein (pyridoxamine 5'-phosphate oxidase superfamily)